MKNFSRIFIAAFVQDNTRLQEVVTNIKLSMSSYMIKWVKFSHFHITAIFWHFIDDISKIKKIKMLLEDQPDVYSVNINSVKLGFGRLPRVVYLDFISQSIIDYALRFNLSFIPHITIGRIKKPYYKIKNMPTFKPFTVKIDKFRLYQSKLTPNGPIYKVL